MLNKTRLHLLMFISELGMSGTPLYLYRIVKHLDQNQFKITVCTLSQEGPVAEKLREIGVSVENLGAKKLWDYGVWKNLYDMLRGQVHIFQSFDRYGYVARPIAKLAGVPVLIQQVGQSAERPTLPIQYRLVDYLTSRMVDVYVFLGEGIKASYARSKKLAAHTPNVIITNGVEVEVFSNQPAEVKRLRQELDISSQHPVLINVSGLRPQKGLTYLVRAMLPVVERFPLVRLLIIGEGSKFARQQLATLIDDLGLKDHIRYLGVRQDIPALLALSDVFVLSSLWEGLPAVVLEAMAAGKPVIATDIIGPREVIVNGKTGLLVPPRDPDALVEVIVDLLQDPENSRKMGYLGQKRVIQSFSAERMGQAYSMLYLDLARKKILSNDADVDRGVE